MRVSRAGVLLAIPFVVIALGALAARRAVPRWGARIGRGASLFVSSFVPPRTAARAARAPASEPPGAPVADDARTVEDGGAPLVAHIPVDAVQWAIDDQGAHVHMRAVRDARGKPAGIRLSGVDTLGPGMGLRDGDILVSIDEAPALTEEAATELALRAVVREDATLRAVALRHGQAVAITADLPSGPLASLAGKVR